MKEPIFIEVLKVKNGVFVNPQPHIERIYRTTKHFFDKPLAMQFTNEMIPTGLRKELVKCRIVYGKEIISIEFSSYTMRNIRTLGIIEGNTIDYSYKYLNRKSISDLLAMRNDCDDILVIKNGLVTDTSYSNVVFKDSHGRLYTPTSTLLSGTKRQTLLDENIIEEKEIHVKDIGSYLGVYLINAMMDIEDDLFVSAGSIK